METLISLPFLGACDLLRPLLGNSMLLVIYMTMCRGDMIALVYNEAMEAQGGPLSKADPRQRRDVHSGGWPQSSVPPVISDLTLTGGSSWETGKDLSLQVILPNLTVSIIKRLLSDRSHARQALGMEKHIGCPHGQCPCNTVSGRRRCAQEATTAQRGGGWQTGDAGDRFRNMLPNQLLDHDENKLHH